MITIIYLPQSLQIVGSRSAVRAGIDMIPLLIFSALGSGLGGALCVRKPIEREILAVSFTLQLLGLGLLFSVGLNGSVTAGRYAYECVAGLGFGLSLSSITIVARRSVDEADLSVAMGLTTQIRVLGGLVGIGACQSLLNRLTGVDLDRLLGAEVRKLLRSSIQNINSLPAEQKDAVRKIYARGYRAQIIVSLGTAAAGLLIASFMVVTSRRTSGKETQNGDGELQRVPTLDSDQTRRGGQVSDSGNEVPVLPQPPKSAGDHIH